MSEPTQPKETAPVPPVQAQKKVKIKLVRDASINGEVFKPGTVHEVDEATAKELCDRKIPGYMPFYGHKPEVEVLHPNGDVLARQELVRAVRVS